MTLSQLVATSVFVLKKSSASLRRLWVYDPFAARHVLVAGHLPVGVAVDLFKSLPLIVHAVLRPSGLPLITMISKEAKQTFNEVKLSVSCWGRRPHLEMQAIVRTDIETYIAAYIVGECADECLSEPWYDYSCQALPNHVSKLTKNTIRGSFRSLEGFHKQLLSPLQLSTLYKSGVGVPEKVPLEAERLRVLRERQPIDWGNWFSNIAQAVVSVMQQKPVDSVPVYAERRQMKPKHSKVNLSEPVRPGPGVRALCKVFLLAEDGVRIRYVAVPLIKGDDQCTTLADALHMLWPRELPCSDVSGLPSKGDDLTSIRLFCCAFVCGLPAPLDSPVVFWALQCVGWSGCLEIAIRARPPLSSSSDAPRNQPDAPRS